MNLNINIINMHSVLFSLKNVVYMQLQKQEYMVPTLIILIFVWVSFNFQNCTPW